MIEENAITPKSKEIILHKLSKQERIHITSGKRKQTTQRILITYLILSLGSLATYLFLHGLSWKIAIIFGLEVILFYLIFQILKRVSDISVKGEHMMINQYNYPCKVTSLKSIKDVKTTRFMRFTWTSLSFNIDGNRQKIIILKKIKPDGNLPEVVINFIKDAA
jgi:uncharacterized membrane protein